MSKSKASKQTRVNKFLKSPIRVLVKFRDWYIKGLSECPDQIMYGSAMGLPTGHMSTLPRSYTVGSTKTSSCDNDLRELIRAASTRSLGNKVQLELSRKQRHQMENLRSRRSGNVGRSLSVGLGRIDEDEVCDFVEDEDKFPRSRSCAVASRRTAFVS